MSVFCPQCGAPVEEGVRTCAYCGATVSQPVQQPVYSAPQSYGAPQQPYPQQPYPQQPYGAPQQPYYGVPQQPQQPQHPMAWYKFVVNVQLILGGIGSIIMGLLFLTGVIYDVNGVSGSLLYRYLPDLKTVDSIYGFMSIAIGVFAFVAQSNLKKFKTSGPSIYYGWLVANIAASVFYLIGLNSVYSGLLSPADMGTYSSSMVSSIVTTVALLICNVIYFKKRKDLFVN